MAFPALALAAAGAAAFWLKRKRTPLSRVLQIVETTALGPKRSLIVARVGSETLLLSSSEAGITLLTALPQGTPPSLTSQSTPGLAGMPQAASEPSAELATALQTSTKAAGPITATLRSLLKSKPAPPPSFETLFAESAEDQELFGKLQSGHLAHVR